MEGCDGDGGVRKDRTMLPIDSQIQKPPFVNLFRQKRLRGWWPLSKLDQDGALQLAVHYCIPTRLWPQRRGRSVQGKLELELELLEAAEAAQSPAGLGRSEPNPLRPPRSLFSARGLVNRSQGPVVAVLPSDPETPV